GCPVGDLPDAQRHRRQQRGGEVFVEALGTFRLVGEQGVDVHLRGLPFVLGGLPAGGAALRLAGAAHAAALRLPTAEPVDDTGVLRGPLVALCATRRGCLAVGADPAVDAASTAGCLPFEPRGEDPSAGSG